jgi:centromeric protein E
MRPLNNPQEEGNARRVWRVLPKYAAVAQTTPMGQPLPEKVVGRTFFQYDQVFGEDATTWDVYQKMAQPIVSSVVQGLNGTIFAYGQTSSGKTYTMQGAGAVADFKQQGGIFHMAAAEIFAHIQSNPDRMFLVRASFLEIYNEEVRDLLVSSGKGGSNAVLQIREDPRRGVFVQAREEIVTDFDSLLTVMLEGEKSRTFASTAMNERSSRSHTIFRVTIESRKKPDETNATKQTNGWDQEIENNENEDDTVLISTLNLVDLAGSESVRHTGATGERQKEGGMINIRCVGRVLLFGSSCFL